MDNAEASPPEFPIIAPILISILSSARNSQCNAVVLQAMKPLSGRGGGFSFTVGCWIGTMEREIIPQETEDMIIKFLKKYKQKLRGKRTPEK